MSPEIPQEFFRNFSYNSSRMPGIAQGFPRNFSRICSYRNSFGVPTKIFLGFLQVLPQRFLQDSFRNSSVIPPVIPPGFPQGIALRILTGFLRDPSRNFSGISSSDASRDSSRDSSLNPPGIPLGFPPGIPPVFLQEFIKEFLLDSSRIFSARKSCWIPHEIFSRIPQERQRNASKIIPGMTQRLLHEFSSELGEGINFIFSKNS